MLNPKNRVIMISGANRGIGLATAHALAEAGYTLSLGARDPSSIPNDAPGGLRHRWEATDVSCSVAWVEATLAEYGRVDGVVMNAGVELGGDLETLRCDLPRNRKGVASTRGVVEEVSVGPELLQNSVTLSDRLQVLGPGLVGCFFKGLHSLPAHFLAEVVPGVRRLVDGLVKCLLSI